MTKIDPELKVKWVNALRSGDYEQGKGQLKKDDKFCCLGVLADVSGKGTWDADHENSFYWNTSGNLCFGALPVEMMSYEIQAPLTRMNDNGYSFDEIADHIEENL